MDLRGWPPHSPDGGDVWHVQASENRGQTSGGRMKKADGVFEGGGVKGIGLVGSLTVFEEEGYTDWQRVAGTSSGAIVASLLAAGYSALELQDLIMDLDYGQLLDYTTRWDILSPLFHNSWPPARLRCKRKHPPGELAGGEVTQ